MNRPLLLVTAVALSASGLAALVSACASDSAAGDGSPEASRDGAPDTRRADLDGGADADSGANLSTCEITRAYVTACNKLQPDGGEALTCGETKFDAWCDANDKAVNSVTYRLAEAQCLTPKNCAGLARRDCEYRTYGTATPSAAQQAVVAAYCQTCEPADPAGCATRKTTYDPVKGPKSTDDVFVAAWELSDALDDEIRIKCTGAALDAGPDAAGCLKQFASCAGGVYIDRLPDCPK